MPIHDWTRVSAGTWHDFHLAWIAEIRKVLNGGILPPTYYAQAEQVAGTMGPDVLTLQSTDDSSADFGAVGVVAPKMRISAQAEMDHYVLKRRTLVIRHVSNDRIVALIEILSPGNKSSQRRMRMLIDKAVEALYRGYLLLIDLFPPGPRDPNGIHGAVWAEFCDEPFELPAQEPLTLAAYSAGSPKRAYVEPTAVGRALIDMPLFLQPDFYVNVPLESSYLEAFKGMPPRWRQTLDAPGGKTTPH